VQNLLSNVFNSLSMVTIVVFLVDNVNKLSKRLLSILRHWWSYPNFGYLNSSTSTRPNNSSKLSTLVCEKHCWCSPDSRSNDKQKDGVLLTITTH
jgi:hypothetical protein